MPAYRAHTTIELASSRDAGLHHSIQPVASNPWSQNPGSAIGAGLSCERCRWVEATSDWQLVKHSIQQTVISQTIDYWRFTPMARVRPEADVLSIRYNVLLLHCIVGPYVFIFYMVFHLNVRYNNNWARSKVMWHNLHWLWHVYV